MSNATISIQSQNERIRRDDFFLVQRAICGDQSAYTKIYTRYIGRLTRQVKGIVGEIEAEDVAMRVIERAFERLHEFQPNRPLGAWMSRMANNLAIDYVRSQKRRRTTPIEADDEDEDSRPLQVPDPDPVPDEIVIEGETRQVVENVVKSLSPAHEMVLRLKYVNNLTIEEVADAMGYTTDSVRKCLHAIRKKLRAVEIYE